MSDASNEAKAEAAGERALAPDNQTRTEATNAILAAIKGVGDELHSFKTDVTQRLDDHDAEFRSMRRVIHGTSTPPPGTRERQPSIAEIAVNAEQGKIASGDVAELKGELLAVRAELARQSKSMGIGKRGLDWIFSPSGAKAIVQLATLAGAAYAAFHAVGH